jgi:amidophosphoribosyltransferase
VPFREECAVFGIWGDEEAARMTYLGLYAQQHRGQESTGIVSCDQNGHHIVHKGLGLVGEVFTDAVLDALTGTAAIGHNRYSTSGANLLINAQPLTATLNSGPVAVAHNGNIVNARVLQKRLIDDGAIFQGTNDTEVLLHLLARKAQNLGWIEGLKQGLEHLEGAYSFVILTRDRLIAVRDPMGFRPLVLGRRGGARVVASETCAFDLIGASFEREIAPGEIFCIERAGVSWSEHSEFLPRAPRTAQCVFEHVYFSRPDSVVFGESVYESRKRMGARLAMEHPIEADLVIPVPDSGVPAALGYSHESGIPFEMGIIRNHYIGRTFIQPSPSIRSFGVKIKLNPQTRVLEGKRVVVVDDSLVRGTTSQKIIRLIRQAGAKEVHFRVASPPTTGGCFYGVDTPGRNQLIAAKKSVEEIREFIEADSLGYLSVPGLLSSVTDSHDKFCAACFTGDYPTKLYDEPGS